MVDKFQSRKIYVESDYDNIILIDPNKIVLNNVDKDSNAIQERLVAHEDLVFYAKLEANVIPRTKLVIGTNLNDSVINTTIATLEGENSTKINFLNPQGKTFLDTSWSDQQTGLGSIEGRGANQTQEYVTGVFPNQKVVRKILNREDTQGLGITRISIKNNPAYIPQVTIEMVDVQGRTLFEQGEQSPYSAFFQLPYPLFNLTVKGYYGKAVKYELMLKSFNARFDPSDGNYKITTEYIGRTSALLSDINIQHLFTVSRMYPKITTVETRDTSTNSQQQVAQTQTGRDSVKIQTNESTRGNQILSSVYDTYISKGLLPKGFEKMSLGTFVNRIDLLETYINEQFGPQELKVLDDIKQYRKDLSDFRKDVFSNIAGSFFNQYIDGGFPIKESVSKGNGYVYYPLKKNKRTDTQEKLSSKDKLSKLIDKYKEKLTVNPTFGKGGSYSIENPDTGRVEKVNSEINFKINIDTISKSIDINSIDFETTFTIRKNRIPNEVELVTFTTELITELNLNNKVLQNGEIIDDPQLFFVFGDSTDDGSFVRGSFLGFLDDMDRQFIKSEQDIETRLSKALAEKIKKPVNEGGLGFNPTIRNVMGIICANADAFLRLLDETHSKAYELRTDPIRLTSIIDPEKNFGTDTKQAIQSVTIDGKLSEDTIVYPWPQYFEFERDNKGNESYVIKYPGDPKSISRTKGYLYDKWPEISFVEEYLKGTVRKDIPIQPISIGNPNEETEYLGITALEFPNTFQPYQDTTEVPFYYEIYERAILAAYYNKLFRPSSNNVDLPEFISDYEFNNIKTAISSSPNLVNTLKEFAFTETTFRNFLRSISNNSAGTSFATFSRENFTKTYITNYVENPTSIEEITVLENSPQVTNGSSSTESIQTYLNSSSTNVLTTYDVYPLTNLPWLQTNLSNGVTVNNVETSNITNQIIRYNDEKKVISNYLTSDTKHQNKPFTDLNWLGNTGGESSQDILNFTNFVNAGTGTSLKNISRQGAIDFYQQKNYKNLFITESFINYGVEYGVSANPQIFQTGLTQIQTTSLLNTPYFANAISVGVDNLKNGIQNPYVGLGYLFVNSLPIATLREKYKTFSDNYDSTSSNYIGSTLTKFSAIHKLPYAWILKYGSIWHRYKQTFENNVDILNGIWDNFDYVNEYDPLNNSTSTSYNIKNYLGDNEQFNITLTKEIIDDGIVTTDTSVNLGFYPKLINDTYFFFTKRNLLTGYTESDWSEAYSKGLNVGKLTDVHISLGELGTNNRVDLDTYFSFVSVQDNTDFLRTTGQKKRHLLLPSGGYLPFNQAKYELTNQLSLVVKPYVDNDALYNGSVRTLWKATNYGYYNHELVRRPTHREYIKQIFSTQEEQDAFRLESDNSYSTIEELFSVFSKSDLDLLEVEFLNFCKPLNDGIPIMRGEIKDNGFFNVQSAPNRRYRNLEYVLSDIMFTSGDFEKSDNSYTDSLKLADQQMNETVKSLKSFIEYDVILKLGNTGKYNRRLFKSFAQPESVLEPITSAPYSRGTLPGDGLGTSIIESQIAFPDEWDTLQTYVGFSTIPNLEYSNDGSYITDFFIDNNINFDVINIITYAPLIKIYATQKLNNPLLNSQTFKTLLNNLDNQQFQFLTRQLNDLFNKCRVRLPKVTTTEQTGGISAVDGDVAKLELWETFKNLNDKWISGGDFQTRTLFEDFLFFDRANRDIGDVFILDVSPIKNFLKSKTAKFSLYALIGEILAKNNFLFMALPSYVNFYGVQEASQLSQPVINYDIPDSAFGTHMSVDFQDSKPKFLCLYIGKPSEHLDMRENTISRFKTDTFDLRRNSNNPLIENQQNKTNWDKSNKVVGFNVDFGTRNQNIFKSVSLDQNQFKNTSETFQLLSDMANLASGDKVAQQSTSLYNVYRTRSYTCSVTSMGNVMIQPTMYFNLRHVPMFYGPYFITNVSHEISVNNGFETSFEGIRVPIFSFPSIDKLVMSINKNLLEKAAEIYRKKTKKASTLDSTQTTGDVSKTKKESSELCNETTLYPDLEFFELDNTSISVNDVVNYIKSYNNSRNIKAFYYGILLSIYPNTVSIFDCTNNNLYGIPANFDLYSKQQNNFSGQVCVNLNGKIYPQVVFDSFTKSIDTINGTFLTFDVILTNLININNTFIRIEDRVGESLAQLYFSVWDNSTNFGYGKTATEIKSYVDNLLVNNTLTSQKFNDIKKIMIKAYNEMG